ncbi:uncharacterized protein LOC129227670 [Uloborus diversus]|uniref:uncharacterized protein LOC129227670 n=1 Tax=Uloborus diversus TaxID=327109 RepID=UPI002409AC45|nr:uncharacterized protein LOC129227670 [Uloborus diversus]
MADDSPGKVQALRAIFSEKNKPVMGMMPPGGKIPNRPWRQSADSVVKTEAFKGKVASEQKVSLLTNTKVLSQLDKKPFLNGQLHKNLNGFSQNQLDSVLLKPAVGPKPLHLLPQSRTNSSLNLNSDSSVGVNNDENIRNRTLSDAQDCHAKSKAFGETIASFMFTNGVNNKENASTMMTDNKNKLIPPVPKPRNIQLRTNLISQTNLSQLKNSQSTEALNKSNLENSCSHLISSDNYVCKTSCNYRKRELPPAEKLGQAPLKPVKPSFLKLPLKLLSESPTFSEHCTSSKSSFLHAAPPLPQKPLPLLQEPLSLPQKPLPQKPSYPCPPRPQTSPPLPPIKSPVSNSANSSLREEIEELYEDTLLGEKKRPSSLIQEYTEEEEAEELYNDAGEVCDDAPLVPKTPKPKDLSQQCPSEYLQPNVHGSTEELYQDAEEYNQEEFYEEMPCDSNPEEQGSPLYSNNKKEIERLKREEEKRLRKEQKEKEKREKELEKLKKKFGFTGEEIPIDKGFVKADSRGGKGDLPVKKGEIVLILRMEGNPSGRWLVKNERGKIGYVELTNIEVDPLSVKSVMIIRRLSVISASEELYCEAKSEEEAIYEVTY